MFVVREKIRLNAGYCDLETSAGKPTSRGGGGGFSGGVENGGEKKQELEGGETHW